MKILLLSILGASILFFGFFSISKMSEESLPIVQSNESLEVVVFEAKSLPGVKLIIRRHVGQPFVRHGVVCDKVFI